MKPTSFKETNAVLGAGGNPDTDSLPVAHSIQEHNGVPYPYIVAKFKLEPAEIEEIQKTGSIWICIMGGGMPPILPTVLDPFNDLGFKPKQ